MRSHSKKETPSPRFAFTGSRRGCQGMGVPPAPASSEGGRVSKLAPQPTWPGGQRVGGNNTEEVIAGVTSVDGRNTASAERYSGVHFGLPGDRLAFLSIAR